MKLDNDLLRSMWLAGVPIEIIARHFRVSKSTIGDTRRKLGIPNRHNRFASREVDPTPEEIEQGKREIRERHMAQMRAMPPA